MSFIIFAASKKEMVSESIPDDAFKDIEYGRFARICDTKQLGVGA